MNVLCFNEKLILICDCEVFVVISFLVCRSITVRNRPDLSVPWECDDPHLILSVRSLIEPS